MVYLACILMSFLACLILGQIDNVPMRKAWSTTCGLFIGFYFYGLNFIVNIGCIFGNYLLMRFLERELASYAMTIFSGTCLLAVSYYHFEINPAEGTMDIDMIFMMNFIKFHMMAVNYSNAAKLDDPVASKDFTSRERYFAEPLRRRMSFMEYVHYFFFCGAAWTGMSHEYRYFDEFINRREDYKNIPKHKLFLPFLNRLVQWVFCLLIMLFLSKMVNYQHLLTDEWANYSFFHRSNYLIGCVNMKVFNMYVGFVAMECNFIACG